MIPKQKTHEFKRFLKFMRFYKKILAALCSDLKCLRRKAIDQKACDNTV